MGTKRRAEDGASVNTRAQAKVPRALQQYLTTLLPPVPPPSALVPTCLPLLRSQRLGADDFATHLVLELVANVAEERAENVNLERTHLLHTLIADILHKLTERREKPLRGETFEVESDQ